MSPDTLLFLRLWTGNLLPDEVGECEVARLLERLKEEDRFRSECVEELALLGQLKVSQAPTPRWLELTDALELTGGGDGSSQPSSAFTAAVMQRLEALPSPSPVPLPERRAGSVWPSMRSLGAMAAAIAVLLALGFGVWRSRGLPVEIVQISEGAGAAWRVGERVPMRRLVWLRGTLGCRLSSGAVLTIDGPAELEFRSAMEVRLHSGKVTADVGEHGKGFVIETPQTRVVDLGTVFGVDASHSAKTDVVVFKGQVEVHEKERRSDVVLLHKGEGVRIEKNRRSSRIVSVSDSNEGGAWSAQDPAREACAVRTVRDSMVVSEEGAKRWPSLRNFYRIVPGGMGDGALAFSDSNDTWNGVPAELVGADQVRTFAVDGFNWWMKLTLELRRPCRVYVLVDQRNPAPDWVRREFVDTGKTVMLDFKPRAAGAKVVHQLPYGVWERTVESAGELSLGAPYENPPEDRKSFHPNRMFGVAVKASP